MTEFILFEDQFDGEWYVADWGQLPEGWEGWWFDNINRPPDKGWLEHRPEYGFPDPNHVNADKQILSPPRTVQYGKLWATVWAGITRRYEGNIQGKLLEFGVWGYVLAGGGNHDDPTRPGLMYDMVGIDPEGGNNGLSDSIVWGQPLENLVRGFNSSPKWKLYTVRARATHNYVSVFSHFHPEWPIEHLGPLFDNAYLKVIEEEEPTCWGLPRIQFPRTVNVAPSVAVAHKVLDIIANEKETSPGANDGFEQVGPSSDEAGLGMVDDKTAVEWNRPLTQHEAYRNFYSTSYPYTKVEFRSTAPEPEPEITLYSQRDARWRDHVYGGGQTLGVAGCLITCVAMLTGDEPPVVAKKLADVGALEGAYLSRPELVTNAYPDLPYGGTVHWRNTAADLDVLASWLENGPVVIETEFAPGGTVPPADQHFVIGLKIDGGDLVIADPWTGEIVRLLERYALNNWSLSRAIYGVRLFGHRPQVTPPPLPLYDNLIGVHQQREAAGVPRYYQRSAPSFYKTVQNFQWVKPIKEWSPITLTAIRPFPNNVTGKDAVQSIIAGIADDLRALAPWLDFVELINEQVPSGNDGAIIEAVDTEIWGMETLKELGIDGILPIIYNVAPGNPWGPWDALKGWHDQQPLLVKGVQASVAMFGSATCGYHNYHPSNQEAAYIRFAMVNGVRRDVGRYYSFRWQEWDKEFAKHGLKPRYIGTEMGPIGTHGPRQDGYIDMMPHDGWKSSDCLGGNRTRLIDELALVQAEDAAWNATHGNRKLGNSVFTTGGGSKWSSFEWGEAEMEAWSTRLEQR